MQNNSRKKKSKRWIKRFPLLTNVLKNQQRIKEAIVESKMPISVLDEIVIDQIQKELLKPSAYNSLC
ncbi:hypothetical protein RO3G_05711 [Rhizopus delemar RA 99-880]|uniref:Uncharacterized protein n=1 Tax=Rhizopus delemar (strain RA 99-880 / ATCC MYA-4621 / FGSC 9543 / NRRL 43880) TaxID=246409 RepID=I1BXS6_RHIO9|nr:hypothetical protein RO3G_05711 [Rhizopus delemar RA 99-880]|eukprot:EIE81006.1 hypothetical protein RO3G_05711 [Rhizopus delemar RA 99-880]